MKKSEVAMLILIASISVVIAFFIANAMPFLKVDSETAKVPTVESIPAGIPESSLPDSMVFNDKAINPTVKTVIGK
ncbi:MAG TPA: hypothetical protein VL362_00705 [Patescibacteria group bacterium]|jgi:hypothetical protein|nr:hypothetical protein [Patescibacteria group bacterium]